MTSVIGWLNNENIASHYITVISDTLYSSDNIPSFHYGSKILPLNLVCFRPSQSGFFNNMYHSQHVGFAYAGSSLIGLNLHALLSTFLSYQTHPHDFIPSLEQISNFVAVIAQKIIQDYGALNSMPRFECIIFGKCAVSQTLKIFHGKIEISNCSFAFSFNEQDLSSENNLVILGDKKEKIEALIKRTRKKSDHPITFNRKPKQVLKAIIKSDKPKYKLIGGHLNEARVDRNGYFQLLGQVQAISIGESVRTDICVLGYEYNEILLGQCRYGGIATA